jgi:N-acetylmuramoyl-L-alanine amidase
MMLRHALILGVCLPLLGLTSGLTHAAATVRTVDLTGSDSGVRLVIGLQGSTKQNVFALEMPDRLVIDLPQTSMNSAVRMPKGGGPVRSVRSGQQPRKTTRLVLELDRALAPRVSSQVLANGRSELIVELGSGSAPVVVAQAATPVAVKPAHAPTESGRDIVIAVDAGHGGQDPGAHGRGGTLEKHVVLAISRALAKRIDAEPGMKAYLTRDSDRFIVLRDRINLARAAKADIFIAVHADAIANREVSGSSVYVLSERGATSEAARWLAKNENEADLKGGVSLDDKDNQLASLLMNLSQTASIESSMAVAERVLSQLDRVGVVRKSRVQQAGFLVLKSPDIPSMLVETAYISNPAEEQKLRTPAYQTAVAEAIFNGVREHFRSNPPDGSLYARQRDERRGLSPVIAGTASP